MKISNILTCAIVSILAAGCVKNNMSSTDGKIEVDQLTILKQQSEQNNQFVVNAKKQLLQLVGDNHFDSYITKHGILNCKDDSNQSSCVLNFYLNEYYKLKYDIQLKKVIEENQPLFKMSVQDMATLKAKILKDNYSHFLIDENPSILQEMRTDFMEKCLSSPKDNIINYINIFR